MKKIILIIILMGIMSYSTSCYAWLLDLKDKAVAIKTTIFGIELTMPDIFTGMLSSVLSIRIGYINHEYTSAPKGSKSEINVDYKDFQVWKLTGNVTTRVGVENIGEVSEDAPKKELVN